MKVTLNSTPTYGDLINVNFALKYLYGDKQNTIKIAKRCFSREMPMFSLH